MSRRTYPCPDCGQALPTARGLVAHMLHENPHGVTTGQLLKAGAGSRYGARIKELRESGMRIESELVRPGEWRYWIPELAAPEVPGWFREWQCWEPTGPGRVCGAHLHGPIGETCPRGHRAQLADVLDTTTPAHTEEEAA